MRTLIVALTLTAVALILFALERQRQLGALADPDTALARAPTHRAVTGAVVLEGALPARLPLPHAADRELGHWSNPLVYAGIGTVLALQVLYSRRRFMHGISARR